MNTASILVAALGLLLPLPLVGSDVVAREGTIPENVGVPGPSARIAPEPINVMTPRATLRHSLEDVDPEERRDERRVRCTPATSRRASTTMWRARRSP